MAKHKKIRVGIIFGGKSAEHEVSLQSAKNIIEAIDKNKYDVTLIGIDKQGKWSRSGSDFLLNAKNPKLIKLNKSNQAVALVPRDGKSQVVSLTSRAGAAKNFSLDVIFPVLHGTLGEDGTMQGLLKLADIPFVGAGVLASAVGMDKDVMKRLFVQAGLPTTKFLTFSASEKINFNDVKKQLGMPLFIKPANSGSSIGINKAKTEKDFNKFVKEAFTFDNKILIEKYIPGREIECAVLGNEKMIASVPGEIIPQGEFYSYQAKYIDENGAALVVPAKLSQKQIAEVQRLAISACKALCIEGMARVDFFLSKEGKFYLNELNTIPGFTKISMYPKLMQASGISYTELIDQLIQLAIQRFHKEKRLRTNYF